MAIVEVIKYNGNPDVFAWKYPSQELGTWTQLVVNESQEAVLVKEGKVLDIFGSGRYTLETDNIPILNKIINLPFGGRTPFTAEVWYINKAYNLDIKWGTPSPIQIQDPKYGIFVPVRSNGVFGIRIKDSRQFLTKLVGTMTSFDSMSVIKYFRGLYITKIKDTISTYLIHKQISILEINAYIDEISQYMKEAMQPIIEAYGIEVVTFYVNEISVPEEDTSVRKLKAALSKRAEMNIVGYSYQQERSFDTLEGAAKNTGASSVTFMEAGMGLGMGLGIGKGISSEVADMAQNIQLSTPQDKAGVLCCSACGSTILENTKFCTECGRKINHCPNCGNDLPDDAKFCLECGYEMPHNCPNCGASVPAKSKFCSECGEKL